MIDRSVLLRLFFKLVLLEEYFFTTSHQYSGILSNLCSLENKKLHVLAMYIRSYYRDNSSVVKLINWHYLKLLVKTKELL